MGPGEIMTPLEAQAAEHRKKWKWSAYGKGSVPEAGLRIISDPIIIGPEMRNTFYDVIIECCGRQARMSHERIRTRVRKFSRSCRSCGHKRGSDARRAARDKSEPEPERPPSDYGWVDPPWPKPRYVPLGYALDCDRGGAE